MAVSSEDSSNYCGKVIIVEIRSRLDGKVLNPHSQREGDGQVQDARAPFGRRTKGEEQKRIWRQLRTTSMDEAIERVT